MRRLIVCSALVAGFMVAGCSVDDESHRNAWGSIVAQDFNSARSQYESILASNPNDPYANLNIGVAFEELGDNAMAAKHYQIAIANGENSPISEVAQDGATAGRETTVKTVATENLKRVTG